MCPYACVVEQVLRERIDTYLISTNACVRACVIAISYMGRQIAVISISFSFVRGTLLDSVMGILYPILFCPVLPSFRVVPVSGFHPQKNARCSIYANRSNPTIVCPYPGLFMSSKWVSLKEVFSSATSSGWNCSSVIWHC